MVRILPWNELSRRCCYILPCFCHFPFSPCPPCRYFLRRSPFFADFLFGFRRQLLLLYPVPLPTPVVPPSSLFLHMASNIPSRTKKIILKLWRTPTFSGAFSGLSNFKTCLAMDKHIFISRADLFEIMRHDEDFILETKKRRKRFPRRKLFVHGFATLWQADLAQMTLFEKYKGFLCCIDLFSRNIYCYPLTSKSPKQVAQAFRKIFKVANAKPKQLETDKGVEFTANKSFFKKEKIYFKTKIGANKASFAEHAIQVFERKHTWSVCEFFPDIEKSAPQINNLFTTHPPSAGPTKLTIFVQNCLWGSKNHSLPSQYCLISSGIWAFEREEIIGLEEGNVGQNLLWGVQHIYSFFSVQNFFARLRRRWGKNSGILKKGGALFWMHGGLPHFYPVFLSRINIQHANAHICRW